MFADLPEDVKLDVTRYLLANNFPRAKQIHDNWMQAHKPCNLDKNRNERRQYNSE